MKAMKTLFEYLLSRGASAGAVFGIHFEAGNNAPERDQRRRSSSRLLLSL
jgi:hypothetical protein